MLVMMLNNEHAGTDHYGVNVTLVAGERLDAVGAPDVPQLGRRVAGARHKSFLGKHMLIVNHCCQTFEKSIWTEVLGDCTKSKICLNIIG